MTTRQIIGKRAEVATRATLEKHDKPRTTPKSRWAAGAWNVHMKHLSGATLGTTHPQPQARRCHPRGGGMSSPAWESQGGARVPRGRVRRPCRPAGVAAAPKYYFNQVRAAPRAGGVSAPANTTTPLLSTSPRIYLFSRVVFLYLETSPVKKNTMSELFNKNVKGNGPAPWEHTG